MKTVYAMLALTGMLAVSGCFSLSRAREPGTKCNIHAGNYGWYLFNSIPLVTGNADEYRSGAFAWFRDDVTMDKLQSRLMREAAKSSAPVENLVWNNYDSVLFSIPFVSIPFPIPYILTYREMQLSGEIR